MVDGSYSWLSENPLCRSLPLPVQIWFWRGCREIERWAGQIWLQQRSRCVQIILEFHTAHKSFTSRRQGTCTRMPPLLICSQSRGMPATSYRANFCALRMWKVSFLSMIVLRSQCGRGLDILRMLERFDSCTRNETGQRGDVLRKGASWACGRLLTSNRCQRRIEQRNDI